MNPMGSGQIAEACFFFTGLCADSQATWRAQGKGRTPLWHAPCQARQPMLQSSPSFFSIYLFLENCLLVPQSSQSSAASNSTTAFQTFPFYSSPWSITPHKGSASDMHWGCLWPSLFSLFWMSTQNLQKGDIKGDREGFLKSRLPLTRAKWGAIF